MARDWVCGVDRTDLRKSLDGEDGIGQLFIYDRRASGTDEPRRIIRGEKTLLSATQMLILLTRRRDGGLRPSGVRCTGKLLKPLKTRWSAFSAFMTMAMFRLTGLSEDPTEFFGGLTA